MTKDKIKEVKAVYIAKKNDKIKKNIVVSKPFFTGIIEKLERKNYKNRFSR